MNSGFKAFLQYTLITLIGVMFLYFVFKGTNWNELLEKFNHTDYSWIAAGMGISIVSHYIRAYRATMLYEALGYQVSVRNSFYGVMTGYMMNYIIPRAGEVSRCAALNKTDDMPVNKSLGTVVTERIFDMAILVLLIMMVFFMQFELVNGFVQNILNSSGTGQSGSNLKWILLILFGGLFAILFLFRKKLSSHPLYIKLIQIIKGFTEGLLSIGKVRNPWLFVLLSAIIWICYLLMMYFCFFSMEATRNLDFMACLTVFALGTIGMVIPAPGAGAGTYHFAIMQSLMLYHVSREDGIAYATIVHGAQMIVLLAIGAVCSILVLAAHKKKSKPELPGN